MCEKDEVAEWSKAVDSGSIPKGRGFESRPHHFLLILSRLFLLNEKIIFNWLYRR